MLTRSSVTPGTVRSSAHGSREFGTRLSSSCVKLVAVPIAFASTIGDSPVTVTDSCTVATPSVSGSCTLWPTATTTPSRMTARNPGSVARELVGARRDVQEPILAVGFGDEHRGSVRCPRASPSRQAARRPAESFTVPEITPFCACATAVAAPSTRINTDATKFLLNVISYPPKRRGHPQRIHYADHPAYRRFSPTTEVHVTKSSNCATGPIAEK